MLAWCIGLSDHLAASQEFYHPPVATMLFGIETGDATVITLHVDGADTPTKLAGQFFIPHGAQ